MDAVTNPTVQNMLGWMVQLEAELQAGSVEAAHRGDYAGGEVLLAKAKHVSRMRADLADLLERDDLDGWRPTAVLSGAMSRRPIRNYPCFEVYGNSLIKIGRGRSATAAEYRHEAPQDSVLAVVGWMASRGAQAWRVADAVSELQGAVPAYRVYLIIRALKMSGCLTATSRGRYAVRNPEWDPLVYWAHLENRFGAPA